MLPKEKGIIDELVEEDNLIPRAKQVVSQWIDNPGKAFMMLKPGLRQPIANLMTERLKNENWQDGFNIFFDKGTRATLEMVLKMMG